MTEVYIKKYKETKDNTWEKKVEDERVGEPFIRDGKVLQTHDISYDIYNWVRESHLRPRGTKSRTLKLDSCRPGQGRDRGGVPAPVVATRGLCEVDPTRCELPSA